MALILGVWRFCPHYGMCSNRRPSDAVPDLPVTMFPRIHYWGDVLAVLKGVVGIDPIVTGVPG
jgi:hypothetical protein